MNEDLNDVSDPSDFKSEFLQSLDASLRCAICKDIIEAPVMAPCSHSFCSLCIRDSLTTKKECPVCRAQTTDGQLKRNTVLSEVMEAYKVARATILQYEQSSLQPKQENSTDSPRSYGMKRKRSSQDNDGPRSKHPKNEMVTCPVCEEIIDSKWINQHLDSNCRLKEDVLSKSSSISPIRQNGSSEKGTQIKAWASIMASARNKRGVTSKGKEKEEFPTTRESKVNYDLKSVKQLRELLEDAGLSVEGSAAAMKSRHEHWVNIWNSELDKPNPRSTRELRQDLERWESARVNARPLPNVEDSNVWLEENRDHFQQLTEMARRKPKEQDNGQD